jgi:hypothetical protein
MTSWVKAAIKWDAGPRFEWLAGPRLLGCCQGAGVVTSINGAHATVSQSSWIRALERGKRACSRLDTGGSAPIDSVRDQHVRGSRCAQFRRRESAELTRDWTSGPHKPRVAPLHGTPAPRVAARDTAAGGQHEGLDRRATRLPGVLRAGAYPLDPRYSSIRQPCFAPRREGHFRWGLVLDAACRLPGCPPGVQARVSLPRATCLAGSGRSPGSSSAGGGCRPPAIALAGSARGSGSTMAPAGRRACQAWRHGRCAASNSPAMRAWAQQQHGHGH